MIGSPLKTVPTNTIFDELVKLSSSDNIMGFVVGMPQDLKGRETDATAKVKIFVKQLKKKFPEMGVWTEDERFTSKMALQSMIDGNISKSRRRDKSVIDNVSAAIILQSFLDRKAHENKK